MLEFFCILFIFADIEDDLKAGELKHKKIKKSVKVEYSQIVLVSQRHKII